MKIAYIAGPLTGKTIKEESMNVYTACKVGQELAKMGFMPFVPHANSANIFAQDYDFWIEGDILLMKRAADLIVLIPGWEGSPGAQEEAEAAKGFGLPVYYWPDDKERLKVLGKRG